MLTTAVILLAAQLAPFPEGKLNLPSLADIDGQKHGFTARATVVLFMATDCPISNRLTPEINAIAKAYTAKGVAFFAVYPDRATTADDVRAHRKQFAITMPAVLDPKHEFVKLLGVKVTPEAAVIGKDNTLLYRGRIEDSYEDHGRPSKNYRKDLRIALSEILAGRKVTERQTAAVGCYIGS
jgi:thiol-disulfide isomerase/thioredoxin